MGNTVNYPRYNAGSTTTDVYDKFYEYSATVNTSEYEAIFSYFESVFKSKDAAGNFTVSLFRISNQTGVPVMELFQQLEGKSGIELNVVLAYYLNSLRSPCTLLGVSGPLQGNWYVTRNVRA